MKRLLSLLLTASLLLGLSACGVHTSTTPPADNGEATTPIVNSGQTNAPEQSDPPPTDETPELPPDGSEIVPPEGTDVPPDDSETEDPPEETDVPEEYVRTVDPYAPMVALTFDDGPHEIYSNQILDVLEANHAVATFFEVGYNAVRYPEILVRIRELGCELASHSYYHHDLTTLSKDAMLTDLAKLDKVIYDATGFMPTLVRPPYGAVNSAVKSQSGRAMILWTVDTQDWRYRDAQTLIDYLQNYGSLDGEIVLMHSIHGSTAEAMETVIPWLIEQGYQLVTVSELMAYYYGELLEANKYYNQTYFARHERTEFPLELPDEPMQTDIPEFSVVPIVPVTTPSDTPDTPTDPPEQTPETDPEAPPQDDEGTIPPEEDPAPDDTPDEEASAPEDTHDDDGETPPNEDPPSETDPPADSGEGSTPADAPEASSEDTSEVDPEDPPEDNSETPSDNSEGNAE